MTITSLAIASAVSTLSLALDTYRHKFQPNIFITEKESGREMQIPYMPEEITFSSNKTRFASYEILDKGEVKIPYGSNVHTYSWKGLLPGGCKSGGSRRNTFPDLRCDCDPYRIQGTWSSWREYGTKLRLLVVGTPINHDVYLEDYDVSYAGAFGDYEYSISFIDARSVSIDLYEPDFVTPLRQETQSGATSYTVAEGDTLWTIATRFYKDGSRWNEIYGLNYDIIEATAKANGWPSSGGGQRIFAGTKLQL